MFLEYGGDGIGFKSRTFTNVPDDSKTSEMLVLDGQERLTSVYYAMHSQSPVPTQTIKKEDIQRYYYLDIEKCLDPKQTAWTASFLFPLTRKSRSIPVRVKTGSKKKTTPR